jgi:peptidylprolyl isomerase
MSRSIYFLLGNCAVLLTAQLFATSVKQEELQQSSVESSKEFTKAEIKLLSQAYGHLLGQSLNTLELDLDNGEILVGIQNAFNGTESPLEESKTISMISALQEKKFKDECDHNLKAAEAFLASNKTNDKVVELEAGKLQYKQIVQGTGEVCKEIHTPIITYVGKYLDGEIFGKTTKEEPIELYETIEGFRKALIGMKVGETREVYIHPELGYGTSSNLSPNALLTFEIALKGLEEKAPEQEDEISKAFPEDAFAGTSLKYENVK